MKRILSLLFVFLIVFAVGVGVVQASTQGTLPTCDSYYCPHEQCQYNYKYCNCPNIPMTTTCNLYCAGECGV